MITLYGITACDTCRKARKTLDAQGIPYRYHDLREHGLDDALLEHFIDRAGLATLLNTRSTTWRTLEADERQRVEQDEGYARRVILTHPTLLKRPLLASDDLLIVGFKKDAYTALSR